MDIIRDLGVLAPEESPWDYSTPLNTIIDAPDENGKQCG